MQKKGSKVLVAARPDAMNSLMEMLAKSLGDGTEMRPEGSLASALEAATNSVPDLVIIDLGLPGGNGFEPLRKMTERLPRTPLVAITNHGDRRRIRETLTAGAHSVLVWGHFDDVNLSAALAEAVAKRDLEDVNKTLKVVNSILRHDVMNNLTVIGGGIDIYRMKKDEKFLDSAANAVEKSVDLIKKMKEVESVVSPKELKPIHVRTVLEEVLSRHIGQGIRFEVEGDVTLIGDDALSSVLENLINNAIIHSGSQVVRITMRKLPENEGEIRIADEGVGIPAEVRPKIWQEGFKYGKGGQSGLGLYIVKKTMERYGGEVQLEDNTPHGCIFTLRFPSADAPSKNAVES